MYLTDFYKDQNSTELACTDSHSFFIMFFHFKKHNCDHSVVLITNTCPQAVHVCATSLFHCSCLFQDFHVPQTACAQTWWIHVHVCHLVCGSLGSLFLCLVITYWFQEVWAFSLISWLEISESRRTKMLIPWVVHRTDQLECSCFLVSQWKRRKPCWAPRDTDIGPVPIFLRFALHDQLEHLRCCFSKQKTKLCPCYSRVKDESGSQDSVFKWNSFGIIFPKS